MISTLLILAVCRIHVIHEPCMWVSLPWVLHSSMARASDQCTEGHRINSCQGLRFLLCATCTLVTFWHIISHFFAKLKSSIILYLSHTWQFWYFYPSSMHFACHTRTLAHDESFEARRIEHLTGVRIDGHRFNSCRGLRFFLCTVFVTCRWHHF